VLGLSWVRWTRKGNANVEQQEEALL